MPVIANVSAKPISDPREIVSALIAQVTGTVRWRESVSAMAAAGVDLFYEIGPGKVLCGLRQAHCAGRQSFAVGTPQDIASFKASRA